MKGGYTPMMLACDNEHIEIGQALILRWAGADISIINNVILGVVCSSGVTTILLLS